MIISSDREHYCYIIYTVKIIRLRNWQTCRPQSLAVPAPRTLFNEIGNVRTAWHCGAMVQPLLQWKSNKHFTFWMCVCSLRYPASACAILLSVPCPALLYFSTLSHKRHDFREKKWLSNMKCVLIFSTSLVWHISHSKKNLARFDQKCILVFILRARYSCYIFRKFEFSRQIFEKYSNVKFQENPSRGSRVVPCGETDGRTNVQGRS